MTTWVKIFTTCIMDAKINIVKCKEPLIDMKGQIKNPVYKLANDISHTKRQFTERLRVPLTYEKIFHSSFKNRNANLSYIEMSLLTHQIGTNLKA